MDKPGKKLSAPAGLAADAFLAEVKKRRPTAPAAADLAAVRAEYAATVAPLRDRAAQIAAAERRLAGLVADAYGLTAEDRALLARTAPPRTPPLWPG